MSTISDVSQQYGRKIKYYTTVWVQKKELRSKAFARLPC